MDGRILDFYSAARCTTEVGHRQVKYLNNVIEGDHGRLKPTLGPKGGRFNKPGSAYRTLQGMEATHALHKGQGQLFAFGRPNPDAVIVAKELGNSAVISFRAPPNPDCNSTAGTSTRNSPNC